MSFLKVGALSTHEREEIAGLLEAILGADDGADLEDFVVNHVSEIEDAIERLKENG